MQNDNHTISCKEDKLGRQKFIQSVSNFLEEQLINKKSELSKSSITIGLYGEWGIGKTSILNCLEETLPEKISTVWLNPWVYNSQEQIVLHLMRSLVQTLQVSDPESKNKLNEFIVKLIRGVKGVSKGIVALKTAGTGSPMFDSMADGAEDVLTSFLKEDELDIYDIKEEINKIFRSASKPIVMFIDDVDRLSNDELIVLFKTIRMLADFNNVCYVLAFDVNAVSKSIKSQYGDGTIEDGQRYIEKIITFPLPIPMVSKAKLLSYTFSLIGGELYGNKELIDIFNTYIDTPRQCKRLANSFLFTSANFTTKLEREVVLAYEIIKLHAPDEFELLKALFIHFENDWDNQASWSDALRTYITKKMGPSELNNSSEIDSKLRILGRETSMIRYCLNITLVTAIVSQYSAQRNSPQNEKAAIAKRKVLIRQLGEYLQLESTFSGEE